MTLQGRVAWAGRRLPKCASASLAQATDMAGGINNCSWRARLEITGSTLYRIHGNNEPCTIGQNKSCPKPASAWSMLMRRGCLAEQLPGAKVIVLSDFQLYRPGSLGFWARHVQSGRSFSYDPGDDERG